jgi:DNA-binding beta-propeller fold protein YncE
MRARLVYTLGTLALVLVAACGSSTGPVASPTPTVPPTYTAYVVDQASGTLTPIPLATGVPGTPFVVGATASSTQAPHVWGIVITKDGKTAYITGGGGIIPVNLVTKTVGTPIVVDATDFGPVDIALSPDEKTAYVVNYSGYKVTPVNLATGTPGTPMVVGSGDNHPSVITITPDGKTAYVVVNQVNNTTTAAEIKGGLVPIDLRTNQVGGEILLGHETGAMAIAANGKTAYAFYLAIDATGKQTLAVAPISLPSGSLGVLIPIGLFFANSMALSPDGKSLYLVQQFGIASGVAPQGGMAALDLATGTLGPVTVLGTNPHSVAIGRDSH